MIPYGNGYRKTESMGAVLFDLKNIKIVIDSHIVSEIKVIVSSEKYIHGGKRKC